MSGHENLVAKFMDYAAISSLAVVAAKEEITRLREALATAETENSRLLADLTLERVKSADAIAAATFVPVPGAPRLFVYQRDGMTHYGVYDPEKNRYFTSSGLHSFGGPEHQLDRVEWAKWVLCRPKSSEPQPKPPGDTAGPRDVRDRMDDMEDTVTKLAGRIDAIKANDETASQRCPGCGSKRESRVAAGRYRCMQCGNAWEAKA